MGTPSGPWRRDVNTRIADGALRLGYQRRRRLRGGDQARLKPERPDNPAPHRHRLAKDIDPHVLRDAVEKRRDGGVRGERHLDHGRHAQRWAERRVGHVVAEVGEGSPAADVRSLAV